MRDTSVILSVRTFIKQECPNNHVRHHGYYELSPNYPFHETDITCINIHINTGQLKYVNVIFYFFVYIFKISPAIHDIVPCAHHGYFMPFGY